MHARCVLYTTIDCNTLKHTATHNATHTATRCHAHLRHVFTTICMRAACYTLQHSVTHFNAHCSTRCSTQQYSPAPRVPNYMHARCVLEKLQATATQCHTLQHTATHHNILQHTATHCNKCNIVQYIMQHTVQHTLCNTLRNTLRNRLQQHCSTRLHHVFPTICMRAAC